MPVGCLSGSVDPNATIQYSPHRKPSQAAKSVDGECVPLLQRCLVIQILRECPASAEPESDPGCAACKEQGQPACCQEVDGVAVLRSLQDANAHHVWNLPLLRAIVNLKYQGYVCPGLLILQTEEPGEAEAIQEAWKTHCLLHPDGFKVHRVGVSQGCTFLSVTQVSRASLGEIVCSVLSQLKRSGVVADMETIVKTLSSLHPRLASSTLHSQVHSALGSLIKSRKVYFTGKGYFLVSPDESQVPRIVHRLSRENQASGRPREERAAQTDADFLLVMSPQRSAHQQPFDMPSCLRSAQSSSFNNRSASKNNSPVTFNLKNEEYPIENNYEVPHSGVDQDQDNSLEGRDSLNRSQHSSDGSWSSSNDCSLRESALERSQSLRISKKSLKKMSKGGSLRLSKKDPALELLQQKGADGVSSPVVDEKDSPKKMERKNSFLGKWFNRKKNSSPPKREIRTFSDQFPPPELLAPAMSPNGHSMLPAVVVNGDHALLRSNVSPLRQQGGSISATNQLKKGPNGNYVICERGDSLSSVENNSRHLATDIVNLSGSEGSNSLRVVDQNSPPPSYLRLSPQSSASKPPPPSYYPAPPYRPKSSSPHHHGPPPPPPPKWSEGANGTPFGVPPTTSLNNGRPFLMSPPSQLHHHTEMTSPKARNSTKQVHFAQTSPPPSSSSHSSSSVVFVGDGDAGTAHRAQQRSPSDNNSNNNNNNNELTVKKSNLSMYGDNVGGLRGGGYNPAGDRLSLPTIRSPGQDHQRAGQKTEASGGGGRDLQHHHTKQQVDTIHNNNNLDHEILYEDSYSPTSSSNFSRSSSVSTLKPDSAPDHPSLSDLGSIADLSSKFQSLTARKLIAGISISSIDTLLEVNAAEDMKAERKANVLLDESTETVDFGVI